MNKIEMTACLVRELGKLLSRSDEKPGTINEGALKFLNTHNYAFNVDMDVLTARLQTTTSFDHLFQYLFGEDAEPCHQPFLPGNFKTEETSGGFLVHIFKGEQDIAPLSQDKINITPKQYYRLLHSMRHDIKRLETQPSFETWLYLLQRYTKWVPAHAHLPYVSLYDYTRVKIALAACLAESQLAEWWQKREAKEPYEAKPLALYMVKITGKEQFLLSLHVDSNLSLFKGGDYYFQLIRENVAKRLLDHVELPLYNCLWESNDTFILLTNASDSDKLMHQQWEIESFLLQHFQGTIGIAAHSQAISFDDVKEKDICTILHSMRQETAKKAARPFADLLQQHPEYHTAVFGPYPANETSNAHPDLTMSLEELGNLLTRARWMSFTPASPVSTTAAAAKWQELLAYFRQEALLSPRKPDQQAQNQIYRFGNTDFACPQGIGFKFSEILPYLTLEQNSNNPASCWAIINLRIDKSNSLHKQPLCTYLSLYEHLQDFFRTYLSSLLREKKYRKLTYFLHTADHRLTIVCSPQIALLLSNQIYQKFRQFTSEKFSLSGKIAVFPSAYPIQQLLFQEKRKFEMQQDLHNRVVVMGENISWGFLENLLKTEEKLATIAKLKGKRFLFPLWGITEMYRIRHKYSKEKKNVTMWRHMINYHLNRLGITDNLEGERGPAYLWLAIQWNYLIAQEAAPPRVTASTGKDNPTAATR
jgi:hypothetical protein